MLLNKDTKFTLQKGDVLRFPEGDYSVVTLHPGFYRNTLSFTLRCEKTHRHIYCTPSSGYYGAEIIRQEELGVNRFATANATYTGGNIWLFHGQLTNGKYFLTDDEGWTRILDKDPSADWDESLTDSWQLAHVSEELPEDKRIKFCDDLADRLLTHDEADNLGGINDDEIEGYRKFWKEPLL